MPFTPFHWGPVLLIGLLLFSVFDMPSLLVSSVIPDVEPFYALTFQPSLPFHGFFHSYLGASILGVLVAVVLYPLRGVSNRIMAAFRLPHKSSSFRRLLLTSLFGVYSHVFLDSFLYEEMRPFFPLESNPFFGVFSSPDTYGFCSVSFLLGFVLYISRIMISPKHNIS